MSPHNATSRAPVGTISRRSALASSWATHSYGWAPRPMAPRRSGPSRGTRGYPSCFATAGTVPSPGPGRVGSHPDRDPVGLGGVVDLGLRSRLCPGLQERAQLFAVGQPAGPRCEARILQALVVNQVDDLRPVIVLIDEGDKAIVAGQDQ